MKTGKYLQESLNFSSALQQMKQEKSIYSPSVSVKKSQSRQNDTNKNSVQNRVHNRKYTKRTNLSLKQLLEQYIQNSENQYILTLQLGCAQEKKHELFDEWISQLGLNQSSPFNTSLRNQNEAETQNQIIMTKETTFVKSDDEYKSKNDHSKIPNAYLTSGPQKTTDKTTRQTIVKEPQKQCQQQEQFKIIAKTQDEVIDDRVVQQLEELINQDQECITKRRLLQKLSQEMSQNQKENAGPTQNKQQKEVKVLQFSKDKRYKSCKKKRKQQI